MPWFLTQSCDNGTIHVARGKEIFQKMYNKALEMKILVLDDARLIRLTVSARLRQAGYNVMAVGTVDEAVSILKHHHASFYAIISDIVMGDIDGFAFRNFVRGIAPSMPIFFMTAMDPEEGSGFLKKIISDPLSYYLPKSVSTDVLIKRMQRVVSTRRIQQFVENQVEEQKKALALAEHVQRNMLSPRAMMDERMFYTTWWQPHESVSGDLYEAMPTGSGRMLFVLGDIQGHGTNAALVMMAVQVFLRQIVQSHGQENRLLSPETIANQLQEFFRDNFADVSYMTAFICLFAPGGESGGGEVAAICCGTSDFIAVDTVNKCTIPVNPQHRGGLPIGLMPDTAYSADDVVTVTLPKGTVCVVGTDGMIEISRENDDNDRLPLATLDQIGMATVLDMSESGSIMVTPDRFFSACDDLGYRKANDDVTLLLFGTRVKLPGIYEATTRLSPALVDRAAQTMAKWCADEGWSDDLSSRLQLVLEEHLMNVYDHGFTDQQRRKDVVSLRLRKWANRAELTVWDRGHPPPNLKVAAGSTETALDLANINLDGHGRGRLMIRQICDGIQRQCYGALNETVYDVPLNAK